jgi:hypothetical protein
VSVILEQQFFALTPDRILDAVEFGGRRATGYALALNSLENRVYEVAFEDETRLVAKFYRPGRWSKRAIRRARLRRAARGQMPARSCRRWCATTARRSASCRSRAASSTSPRSKSGAAARPTG